MTEAESNRTELEKWRDYLVSAGGTPKYNDTITMVLRRIAEALGVTLDCCTQYTEYRLMVKIGIALGVVTSPSTSMPPIRLRDVLWGTSPNINISGYLTDEEGRRIFYYDPDTGEKVYVTT